MAELRCEHLAASYGERSVLDDINLVVGEGTLTAILGSSGSGKTTLLRVIIGFSRPVRGRVLIGGTVVSDPGRTHVRPEKRGVGYVAQEGALYPHLTVGENVGFGLARPERKSSARIAELLRLVGLDHDYAQRDAHELSGGEQRRVSLARALAPRPRLVLLDEPFSGLDAALRADTRQAVQHALAEAGTTAVLVTHDQAEALSMGDEVALLRCGRLVQSAAPTDLYRMPVDLDAARFVGDAVIVSGDASAGTVSCAFGVLPTIGGPRSGAVSVMIRPEQILLWRQNGAASAAPDETRVAAVVTGLTYYGAEIVVQLELTERGHLTNSVIAKRYSHDGPQPGETVHLSVAGPVVAYPRSVADAEEVRSVRRR